MLKIIRSVLVLLLASALYSACSTVEASPTVITQASGRLTATLTAQVIGKPTVTPALSSLDESPPAILPTDINQPTTVPLIVTPTADNQPTAVPSDIVPMDLVQPAGVPPDIVHLGVSWADFSLRFDPLQWEIRAFDDHWPDLQLLTHRTIIDCRIVPNIPVGFGEGWTIEKKQVTLGQLELQVRSFYFLGKLDFVGYYNFLNSYGDGAVEVHFVDDSADCIQAAEALFATTEVLLP